jgi:hypothetical protein
VQMISVRDRLYDGIALTTFGVALLAAAAAPVIALDGEGGWVAAEVLSIPAALALGLGVAWIRRTVTVSEQGIALQWAFANLSFASDDIAGVRIRPAMGGASPKSAMQGVVIVRSARDESIAMGARALSLPAVREWLDTLNAQIVRRWYDQLRKGELVAVSEEARLIDDDFLFAGHRIHIGAPFELKRVPAGTYGSALLTVSQGSTRIIVEEKEENFLALARYLEERRSVQADRAQ